MRKKARALKQEIQATGGGGCKLDALNDVENKLMGLIGWVTVTGCVDLPEEIDPEENKNYILQAKEGTTEQPIIIEDLVIDFIDEVDAGKDKEQEKPNVPETLKNTTAKERQKHQKREYTSQSSHLVQSAELYATGNSEMASAMKEMASSMKAMSDSFNKLADALVLFADAIKNKV